MTPEQQKTVNALAEKIGWRIVGTHANGDDVWYDPIGNTTWSSLMFNPYKSETDNAALVDWMVGQCWRYYEQFEHVGLFGLNKETTKVYSRQFRSLRDRKTAITECAAEALGLLSSQDKDS